MSDAARKEEDYVVVINEESLSPSLDALKPISHEASMALQEFARVYHDIQAKIAEKDAVIHDLSYKLGKAETELANSVQVTEYRHATYMLETTQAQQSQLQKDYTARVTHLEREVQKRTSALIGITILFVLVMAFALVFAFWMGIL